MIDSYASSFDPKLLSLSFVSSLILIVAISWYVLDRSVEIVECADTQFGVFDDASKRSFLERIVERYGEFDRLVFQVLFDPDVVASLPYDDEAGLLEALDRVESGDGREHVSHRERDVLSRVFEVLVLSALEVERDRFADVLNRFFTGFALRDASGQSRNEDSESAFFLRFENDRELHRCVVVVSIKKVGS